MAIIGDDGAAAFGRLTSSDALIAPSAQVAAATMSVPLISTLTGPATAGGGRTGREYLRVSYDRSGRERSQEEQHADNARACSERGIRLAAAYREAGSASASRYAKKGRMTSTGC